MLNMIRTAIAGLDAALRARAVTHDGTAQACSSGGEAPDGIYTSYDMTLVPVSDEDKAKVAEISATKILPEWGARCEASYVGCVDLWNETVGAARGLTISLDTQ